MVSVPQEVWVAVPQKPLKHAGGVQVNEILEALLQQLQAHNHPHASAVQAAINLASASFAPHRPGNQVHHLPLPSLPCQVFHHCCDVSPLLLSAGPMLATPYRRLSSLPLYVAVPAGSFDRGSGAGKLPFELGYSSRTHVLLCCQLELVPERALTVLSRQAGLG